MNRRQQRAFKVLFWIMGICLTCYLAGPPLFWALNDTLSSVSSSCPPCHCDCSLQPLQPLLSIPEGFVFFLL